MLRGGRTGIGFSFDFGFNVGIWESMGSVGEQKWREEDDIQPTISESESRVTVESAVDRSLACF